MSSSVRKINVLRKLLHHGAPNKAAKILERLHPADIAQLFVQLGPGDRQKLMKILQDHGRAADTLVEMPETIRVQALENLDVPFISSMLADTPLDDAVAIVSSIDAQRVDAVLSELDPDVHARIENIRRYPAESAGAIMTSSIVTLGETATAQEAIEAIRRQGEDAEMVSYLYVVESQGVLTGVVPIRQLLTASSTRPIRELMETRLVKVGPLDHREKAGELAMRYDLLAVPVVGEQGVLLGVITIDDLVDVMQMAATEDIYRVHGLEKEDRVFSPVTDSVRLRFPWMLLNLCTAFLAALVVGMFERTIASVVVLATFMPVVAGLGGNGGTQTLTVITRGIALGEMKFVNAYRAIFKQVAVGLIVGAGAGIITAVVAWAWKGMPVLGLVLFLAMIINMVVAGFVGAAAPLALKALGKDPALGGGIIITTFTDVTGFCAFLGLGTLFINYLH